MFVWVKTISDWRCYKFFWIEEKVVKIRRKVLKFIKKKFLEIIKSYRVCEKKVVKIIILFIQTQPLFVKKVRYDILILLKI